MLFLEFKGQPIKSMIAGARKMPGAIKVSLIILLAALIFWGIYAELANLGYVKAFKTAMQIQNSAALSKEDQQVLSQLKKIMLLSDTDTPSMAVITDIDALRQKQPAFFANAKKGDRLILYPDTAIIFDAKANKIIKVGSAQLAPTPAVQPVNFAIYNSLTADPANAQTAEMETTIKAAFSNAVVTAKANSAKANYTQTLVIDLAGNNPEIQKIADALGAKVSPLPSGEKNPEGAAVLVIIGK